MRIAKEILRMKTDYERGKEEARINPYLSFQELSVYSEEFIEGYIAEINKLQKKYEPY